MLFLLLFESSFHGSPGVYILVDGALFLYGDVRLTALTEVDSLRETVNYAESIVLGARGCRTTIISSPYCSLITPSLLPQIYQQHPVRHAVKRPALQTTSRYIPTLFNPTSDFTPKAPSNILSGTRSKGYSISEQSSVSLVKEHCSSLDYNSNKGAWNPSDGVQRINGIHTPSINHHVSLSQNQSQERRLPRDSGITKGCGVERIGLTRH